MGRLASWQPEDDVCVPRSVGCDVALRQDGDVSIQNKVIWGPFP